jgi:AraC family L-rhamnose operon regulatory protein RhaS
MPKAIPIYKDHDETYRADSCQPLVHAVSSGRIRLGALGRGHYPGRCLPEGSLPGVKMIGYWDAPENQDWGLDWHRNEGVELTFLERGRLAFAADGREYILQPDDFTVSRPWQLHRVGNPYVAASRLDWLIIDLGVRRPQEEWKWPPWLLLSRGDREELTTILRHNEQPVWHGTPGLRRCWQEIAAAIDGDKNGSSVSRVTIRLNDVFLLLLDMFREKRVRLDESLASSKRTVELFLQDLRSHPDHLALEWTVQEMASSCGLGISQFIQHVRRLTNMTPVQYLTHCRLEFASQLLTNNPQMSITDVALTSGFASSQYFATVFTRHHGFSPREYRARGDLRPLRVGRRKEASA